PAAIFHFQRPTHGAEASMRSSLALVSIVSGLVLLLPASSPAQTTRERVDTEVINKIREEGLKKSKAMETISYLTDVHGPRLTASPRIRTAGEWTKGRLKEWGLENVHLETWGPFGRGWNLEGFICHIVQPRYVPL